MDAFQYIDSNMQVENLPVAKLAEQFGTPCYIYSLSAFKDRYNAFTKAASGHPHLVCYAVKANSNLAILQQLARLGAGFDIVSMGELARVLKAGGAAEKTVFSGVAKSAEEIRFALQNNIKCFNVESESELLHISSIASELNITARISLRVNPNIDAKTHPYISTGLKENKFGVTIESAHALFSKAATLSHIEISGIDFHIGSQITETSPFLEAVDKALALIERLKQDNIHIKHLDVGGGLGVVYDQEQPPEVAEYIQQLITKLTGFPELQLIFEPGRAIAANAGILVTKVEYLKHTAEKSFAIVDAGMNDLLRPSLYQAWQDIVPVHNKIGPASNYDIVGPVCETGDFLGKNRSLYLEQGDLLAVKSAGAYGFTMSSNYNSRPRVCEVLVDGNQAHLIRERETVEQLWQGEHLLK